MRNLFVNKLTNFIVKNKNCTKKDIIVYRYGLEALYSLLTKTVVFLTITFFTKSMKECLLVVIFYMFLRLFAYGIHANSSIGCWLTTLPIYVGGSLFVKYVTFNPLTLIISWLIYLLFVILWAPADTKKRPLIHKRKRIELKIKSIIVAVIYGLIFVFIKNNPIHSAIGFCLILEAICICPLTYYITGNRFNNYIYYNQEHGLN